nr:hypothetical protein Cduv_489 [Cedratvirus duvanny]
MNASLYSGETIRKRIEELESREHKIILVDEDLLFEFIYFSALGEIDKPVYQEYKGKYRVLIDLQSIERLKPFVKIFTKGHDNKEQREPFLYPKKN